MKVLTEAVHFTADQKLTDFTKKKLEKLETVFNRIIEVRVTYKLENAGQVKDKIAEIRVSVPGDVLVVKNTEKTFEAAVDKNVDVLKRQLIKYKEQL